MVVPRAKVFLHARTLRENDDALFPRDPLGRNRGAQLSPPSILNLILSVASAEPITRAPELVRAWRKARYSPPMSEVLGDTPESKPILPGQNLALDLESLINLLARPSDQERQIRYAFDGDFRVILTVGEALVATVERPSLKLVNEYDAKGFEPEPPKEQTFCLQGRRRQAVPLRRIVHLDFSYFEVAAALWADSLAHGAIYEPSLLELPHSVPKDETAASDPGKGQNAAVTSDQPAETELGQQHPHTMGEREKSQPSSESQAGHSPQPTTE